MLRLLPALAALVLLAVPAAPLGLGSEGLTLRPFDVPNEVIVGFDGAIPADVEAWLGANGGQLLMRDDTLHWVSARFADAMAAERMLLRAEARGDVRYAERDGYAQLAYVPNDPMYSQQWGFPAISAEQAWDITLGSHDVKVSVVDTGVRVTHPDLAANMCGPFVSTVPGSPNPDDDYGHGTHVAGTVAAVTNNALGVAGTAQVCVMSARVLERGGGPSGTAIWSWVAAGVVWSVDNGADIVEMSLQTPTFYQVMQDAVRYAFVDHDVLVVSAAGNYGCSVGPGSIINEGSIAYPGKFDESMAVAALEEPGLFTAGFSSCGKDMEIAAPGASVLSTVPGPGYAFYSGTSMATPHVGGVAALVKSQNPGISAFALRCLLDLSADDVVSQNGGLFLPGRDFYSGWGKLNAHKALVLDQTLMASGGYAAFEEACRAGAPGIMY